MHYIRVISDIEQLENQDVDQITLHCSALLGSFFCLTHRLFVSILNTAILFVSDIAVFVLKRDVKLQLTN